jgi:hypothetical protein
VSDIEILSKALLPGSIGFTIEAEVDGLSAITQLLATTGAKYLAIVAHGEPGVVHLGKNPLNIDQLQAQSHLLSAWGVKEIALYSCEVAKGDIGKGLIYQLSELTGATVAASAIKTGNQALGGSWNLAVATGEIAAPKLFEAKILQTYQSVLAVSFSSVNTYPLGINPYSTRTADLNGDGFDDIFSGTSTPNNTNGSISVLLSNGTGGFLPAATYAAGIDPFSVVSLDVNADGKLDLVASNGGYGTLSGTGTVSVLLNTGKGILGTATPLGLGVTTDTVSYPFGGGGLIIAYNPNSPRVGDFNNDGIPDLLVVDTGYNRTVIRTPNSPPVDPDPASRVSVFLSGKDGFSAPIVSPASVLANVATLGDFNNDGNLDVVTLSYKSNNISLMLGDGTGSFIAPISIPDPYIITSSSAKYVRTGDFNSDGKLDIVVSDGDSTISVLLGNITTGRFDAPKSFTAGNIVDNLVVGDINGDGKLDVTTNSTSTNTISILLGDGVGGFGIPTILAVGSSPQQVSIGNFNGDGKPDLVTGNQSSQDVSVLLNNTISSNVARNDFNNDGKSDILWRNDDGSVALWQMDGSTLTSGSVFANVGTDWKISGTGDFNADGKTDILWRNNDGQAAIWQMNGTTSLSQTVIGAPTTDWKISGTGDFNADGKADILWRNDDGQAAIWQMNGSTPTTKTVIGAPTTDWKIAGTGDFNADGKSDILWRNDDGSVALWQMSGTTATTQTVIGSATTDWKIAGTGDFNADGKADILWRNNDGRVAIWQMNGTTTTSVSFPYPSVDNSWKISGTSDFNGDGTSDILWKHDNGGVETWLMKDNKIAAANLVNPTSFVETSWKVAAPIL